MCKNMLIWEIRCLRTVTYLTDLAVKGTLNNKHKRQKKEMQIKANIE